MDSGGTALLYDLPAPLRSHCTTTKSFSRGAWNLWAKNIVGIPGPPCRKSSTGLLRFRPRRRTYCSMAPILIFSSDAMLPGTSFPSPSRIDGVYERKPKYARTQRMKTAKARAFLVASTRNRMMQRFPFASNFQFTRIRGDQACGFTCPDSGLLARVNGSPSWHIQSRSDGGTSPTVGRLRAVVRITYYMAISQQLS